MEQPASQASSHFPIEPVSASVLVDTEVRRRDALRALGHCRTGCEDLDDYVLLGGLERGCVVGLSTEDEDMGVLLGMQLLVHTLCGEGPVPQNALIVTPKPANAVLGTLRASLARELAARRVPADQVRGRMKDCLDRTMLSCVFDIDGLWEVLADLDRPAEDMASPAPSPLAQSAPVPSPPVPSPPLSSSPLSSPPPSTASGSPMAMAEGSSPAKSPVLEIQDSQEEDDDLSLPATPPAQPEVQQPRHEEPVQEPRLEAPKITAGQSLPHFILVTHFSSLLTGLFTHREKSAAHTALQLLGSHMHYLSRNLSSSPLITLLNSTTASADSGSNAGGANATSSTVTARADTRPLDPTLCSIFNPPSLPLAGHHYAAGAAAARRNKPRFGLVFSQLLDVHLLGTLIPRDKDDADAVYAPPPLGHDDGSGVQDPRFVTIIEVLLDEMGLWEGKTGPRRNREQRWTAVDIQDGRVVDAFPKKEPKTAAPAEIRLAGGFGGRRV